MSPDVYNLSLETWQYFVTLTYRSEDGEKNHVSVPKVDGRRHMLFAFLREVAKGLKKNGEGKRIDKVHFSKLLWAAREERGEFKGRYHFHILISGLPPGRMNQTERFTIKEIWKRCGGGHSDVRIFDTRLSGVQYVLKGLEEWSRSRANAYEMRKFEESDYGREVILANACVEKWARGSVKPRPTEGTENTDTSGLSLSGRRKAAADRTKQAPAYEGGLWVPSMHPAGTSFVR
ncbi:hypothetical protein [Verrucomicrobium sp. BvORR034]|uniref:rolling circle replication-associated protein n=1 Tax=Verrucomicrobium sp. BvORR034 TaxID=1396418 RepID=UPI0006790073|nr:hypothetical protein [Verrucomicrobium sp. BvORR034]